MEAEAMTGVSRPAPTLLLADPLLLDQAGDQELGGAVEGPLQEVAQHAPPRLLLSNPTDGRTRLTLRMSSNDGRSWPVARVVYGGPAAYSDLTVLPDGAVGCLFERGTKSPYEAVAFARIPLEWLTAAHGGAGNADGPR